MNKYSDAPIDKDYITINEIMEINPELFFEDLKDNKMTLYQRIGPVFKARVLLEQIPVTRKFNLYRVDRKFYDEKIIPISIQLRGE